MTRYKGHTEQGRREKVVHVAVPHSFSRAGERIAKFIGGSPLTVFAAQDVVCAVEGTLNRVDTRTKTFAVKNRKAAPKAA